MTDCLFCKIIEGKLPSAKIYENEHVVAFLDINPVHPGHTLVVPKRHSTSLFDMLDEDIAAVFHAAKKIAQAVKEATGAGGINVNMNNDPAAGQVVFHSHIHIVPRFENDGLRLWPGRKYGEGQQTEIQKRIVECIN